MKKIVILRKPLSCPLYFLAETNSIEAGLPWIPYAKVLSGCCDNALALGFIPQPAFPYD